ncbi:MAG TPA: hypothetical protein PLV92_28525, partial [Pirellulaceae bacterium]|nr:hypothetical protein [Pirellulaceae bacterium]
MHAVEDFVRRDPGGVSGPACGADEIDDDFALIVERRFGQRGDIAELVLRAFARRQIVGQQNCYVLEVDVA